MGRRCRDLGRRFSGAVRRWTHEGTLDRMEGDGSGIPCETGYDQFEIDKWIQFDRVWRVP